MSKTNEVRLIDANALRAKAYAFPCAVGVEHAVTMREIDEAPTIEAIPLERLGEFGKIFMDYKGCPRGAIGRACMPIEEEVLQMKVLIDIDGGKWIPVNAEALHELVEKYITMSSANEISVFTLNALRDEVYQDAVAHGLWKSTDEIVQDIIEVGKRDGDLFDQDEMMRGWAMQVIIREVGELEAACGEEAYAEELADVVIAALSVAGKLGIDIDAAVKRKMEVNRGRPWKHGKGE